MIVQALTSCVRHGHHHGTAMQVRRLWCLRVGQEARAMTVP